MTQPYPPFAVVEAASTSYVPNDYRRTAYELSSFSMGGSSPGFSIDMLLSKRQIVNHIKKWIKAELEPPNVKFYSDFSKGPFASRIHVTKTSCNKTIA